MVKIKKFNEFLNENEADVLLTRVKKDVSMLPPSKVQKTMEEAEKIATDHGYDLEDMSDIRIAAEIFLREFSKKEQVMENLDEGIVDWFSRVKEYLKKLMFKIGSYGGLTGAILSIMGSSSMLGFTEKFIPDWYRSMCESIFPRPDSWSFVAWQAAMVAIFAASLFTSTVVGIYSFGKYREMEDKYRKF